MKNLKNITLTLIYILIELFLHVDLSYSLSNPSNLRPPLQCGNLAREFIGLLDSEHTKGSIDEHLVSNDKFSDVLKEILNFGPQRKPSQETLDRRDLLIIAYPEIARSIIDYFEKAYPGTDFSLLKTIITIGGSASNGVAINGSDLDLYFLIDDSLIPAGIKFNRKDKRNIVIKTREILARTIDEYELKGIRKLHPAKIQGEKVWFLRPILKNPESFYYERAVANTFLISCGPVESVRRKLLNAIVNRRDIYSPYKKWKRIQEKWGGYINNKHANRLEHGEEALSVKLPDLTTMLVIYNIYIPDGMSKPRKHSIVNVGLRAYI